MSLNFDSLPKEKIGGSVLPDGKYNATIKDAKMVNGKSGQYLQVVLSVASPEGSCTIFDNFFDSDKPLPQYKVGQFLRSINCILQGSFELSDLPKIIINKKLIVALKSEQNEGYAPRNVINAFDDEIYYPVPNSVAAKRQDAAIANDDEDCPFTIGPSDSAGDEY